MPVGHFRQAVIRIPAGSSAAEIAVPVTATHDARIAVGPRMAGRDAKSDALLRLQIASPKGRAVKPTVMTSVPSRDGAKAEALTKPFHSGIWELEGAEAGDYKLALTPEVRAAGASVILNEPSSKIDMAVQSVTPHVFAGDTGIVRVTLSDAGRPISGATLSAHIGNATNPHGAAIAMREIGGGVYEGNLTDPLTERDPSGTYAVDIDAQGTSGGLHFARSGSTAFTYVVPTGRITSTPTPRIVRDPSGKVTAFEADFEVEAASPDRFEVSAVLTTTGSDGLEHPVAEAQTSENVQPGKHTMTLSFDAGYAQFHGVGGEMHLRKVTLFSQGHNVLLQRDDAGYRTAFASVRPEELKPLAVVPPGLRAYRDHHGPRTPPTVTQ
jgi:hypothetical protein